jgi:hypothetical protein
VQTPSLRDLGAIDGELTDPDTWAALERALAGVEAVPAVIIGSEDESVNVQSAIIVRRRWPESLIFVRCQNQSSFAEELAKRHRFIFLSVDALVRDALCAALGSWLGEPESGGVESVRQKLTHFGEHASAQHGLFKN